MATSPTEISTLSLHDALPISVVQRAVPLLAIQGDPEAKFDPQTFTWLGSLSSFADDAYMLVVNSTQDRKSTRLNSSHVAISYAVFCLKKKNTHKPPIWSLHTL